MTQPVPPSQAVTFAYRAQDQGGHPLTGTIDAASIDDASIRLRALGLRITSIEPTPLSSVVTSPRGALRSTDFLAFNEQLAQLATAGLPVEHGLKLIAQDMRSGRLADTVRTVAEELDRGTSLAHALANHRNQFPPLYAQLVDAGIRSNNLGGMLMNLNTHLELVRRLRAAIWRATSYPAMVFAGLIIVLLFLSYAVFPQFRLMYETHNQHHAPPLTRMFFKSSDPQPESPPEPQFPLVTQFIFVIGDAFRVVVPVGIVLILVAALIWRRVARHDAAWERLAYRLPLIGPILRWSAVSRWCDIVRLGISAGLDLPASVHLAGDAIGSSGLQQAGDELLADLETGRLLDGSMRTNVLPATVPAAIELAARTSNLPATLESLTELYQRQAEARLDNLPIVLTPFLLFIIACMIGGIIAGLMLPVLNYIRWITAS